MDVLFSLSNTSYVQAALSVVASLQLTAPLFPPEPHLTDGQCFDVIVVGAGSAGCALAARLADRGDLNVLLIEAGGDPPIESLYPGLLGYLPNSQWDWNYTAETKGAQRDGLTPLTRGRMLGGTSGVNYMAYVRGSAENYEAWSAAAGDSSWDWNHLLPFFLRSERLEDWEILQSPYGRFHSVLGQLGVTRQPHPQNKKYLEAFHEVGNQIVLDINSGSTLGYTEPMFTIAQGVRQSSAYAFLRNQRANLHIARNTRVTRILFDENRCAVGVRAIISGQEVTLQATRQVVLSAGTLNSPQLLQLSGVGPASMLLPLGIPVLADLPVGLNLQDHTGTLLFFVTDPANETMPSTPYPTEFPVPLTLGFGTTAPKGPALYESQNLVLPPDSPALLQFCSGAFGIRDDFCQQLYERSRGREVLFTVIDALKGKSRGRVSLRSANAADPPLVDLGQYSAEEDVDEMVDYVMHFLRVTNSSYFQRVGGQLVDAVPVECSELERGSRTFWRCYVQQVIATLFHYGGTCSLGAVVDARLRVRGVHRLRVADASIMPTLPGGNINAPSIMIGERAAHLLLEDLTPSFAVPLMHPLSYIYDEPYFP